MCGCTAAGRGTRPLFTGPEAPPISPLSEATLSYIQGLKKQMREGRLFCELTFFFGWMMGTPWLSFVVYRLPKLTAVLANWKLLH